MKLTEIKELIKDGTLKVRKIDTGIKSRRKFIWDKDYNKILEVKIIKYQSYMYRAEHEDGSGYRISKKDYLSSLF